MSTHLIVLVGVSGSGKATLINAVAQEFPQLKKVRGFTTRPRRGPEDDESYDFIGFLKFGWWLATFRVVQWDIYNKNVYGNHKGNFTAVGNGIGILAMTENGARALRKQGFDVRIVKVVAIGAPPRPDRAKADKGRLDALGEDHAIVNDFTRQEGLRIATSELLTYILTTF